MQRYSILWADDEIDLLKPHILFLTNKGYDITPVNSGADAIDKCENTNFDIIFLDEHMPGMTGLETLAQIKTINPNIPVVMITKNEEEQIMEEAIGSKIEDYLIKPINPNQILLAVKKILDKKRIVSEKTNFSYQRDFQNISMAFNDHLEYEDWIDIYRKLVFWDIEINETENKSMTDVLDMQKAEANVNFTKFIKENYQDWLNDPDAHRPMLSHELMQKKVFPLLQKKKPVFFIVIDNLRLDQWKILESTVAEYFKIEEEDTYFSILPTTTAFARNSIFSGLLPLEMAKKHPDLWVNEDEEGGKNNHEHDFLEAQIQRLRLNIKSSYNKVIHVNQGKQVLDNLNNLLTNDLNTIVYNFVDMLSHARTDQEMIRELAPDESAYRSLTKSWFQHSALLDTLRILSEKDVSIVLTTDHGTIRTKRPYKIIGDRNTNTNLRYKQGKNLSYDKKYAFAVSDPESFFLPKVNVSTSYAFATEDYFFAYPNNYNYYVNYYKDTFQHGGISMEEMIIPCITLGNK
ncbi:bifunctional response regulator/alkaline phosphatase family protein [Rapidithrix thailandica]|uniref:Bifunctional response regulator/alkaline phosphatase family protein n=1 Tax=Rapidithrix thailandica TaxID=413964 RepID=A0AAW9SCH4_9BACT